MASTSSRGRGSSRVAHHARPAPAADTPLVELEIRALATGGDAVGHPVEDDGGDSPKTWFVPEALPGERVRVRATKTARNLVHGELVEIVTPSPDRVAPPCPLAGVCGGCSWQHVAASAQRGHKLAIVRDALRKLAVEPVLGDAPAVGDGLAYRRRARFHYRRDGGELTLGFMRKRSNEVVDLHRCPVLVPVLEHALARLRLAIDVLSAEGEVHALTDGKVVVLGLPGVRHSAQTMATLEACLDRTLVGIEIRGGRSRHRAGPTHLEIDGGGGLPPMVASPFVFTQARSDVNRALLRHVLARARPHGKRVLELYAGAGNFTRAVARVAARVYTCDDDREATSLLRKLAEDHELPINAKHGDVSALLPKIAGGETRYDVVIADPPRAGLGKEAAAALAQVATERIVIVACDPATLARDLDVIVRRGWEIEDVAVFDLMPMTAEVECVATLRPKGRGARA
jgi:23S rRNA (uracil1939-C5)-methyltransferase